MIASVNRRSFLYGASVAGFGVFGSGRHGWAGGVGPNEVLNIACIGVGGREKSEWAVHLLRPGQSVGPNGEKPGGTLGC